MGAMLDIKFIRENAGVIKEAARKKRIRFDVGELLELDMQRLALLDEIEQLRAEQYRAHGETRTTSVIAESSEGVGTPLKGVKERLQAAEEEHKKIMHAWQVLMLSVPNLPDFSVPEGESDADNQETHAWGERPQFPFTPKDHAQLMATLDMLDSERGVKLAGPRGHVLKGDGVRLSLALWQCALDFFAAKGFTPLLVPSLVRREPFLGTGFLPQGEENLYVTQDGEFLSGTAEVATMGYHMNEMLDPHVFPLKYLSFSPCFRRAAGSHGQDVHGLFCTQEFYEIQQVMLCEANHESSVKFHEWLTRNTEEFLELLGLPYRTVVACGADLGLGQVKKYKIELWVPFEQRYREMSSTSYFHDFETRRLHIRKASICALIKQHRHVHATAFGVTCGALSTGRWCNPSTRSAREICGHRGARMLVNVRTDE